MPIDPAIGHQPQLWLIIVPAWLNAYVKQPIRPVGVESIKPFEPGANPVISVHRKNRVVPRILEQQRARRDEGSDMTPWPLESIDQKHAVTVAIHDFLAHILFQVTHPTDGHCDFHSLIRRRDPERRRATARNAGHREPVRIDLRPALQIIERANAVPALDARGRKSARLPPPPIVTVSPMVNACDFAELQRVNDQANVSVRGKPHPVMLESRLVAVAPFARMATDIEHRRQFCARLRILWQIKISGNVKSWAALKMQFLDAKAFFTLQNSRDLRIERRPFR